MEDNFTDAIKEAYASCPNDVVILATLEINHVSWTNPVWIVNDRTDLDGLIPGYWDSTGEAPVWVPEHVVTYVACPFRAIPPESTDRLPEVQIHIDNVSNIIGSQMELAMTTRSPITIAYREYLSNDPELGPHYFVTGLALKKVSVTEQGVTGTATFGDYTNRMFPNKLFTAERFPGLVR